MGSKSSQDSGWAQSQATLRNAANMTGLANYNASLLTGVAAENAAAYNYIGGLNAEAIEQSTMFNVALLKMENEEDIRRHIYQERVVAGSIRAAVGSAGIQTNTGAPLHYLNDQMHQGFLERQYIERRGELAIQSTYEMGMSAANIARAEAAMMGEIEMRNAAAQAELGLMEAMYGRLSAYSDSAYFLQQGQSGSNASLWGGFANAFTSFASIYGLVR